MIKKTFLKKLLIFQIVLSSIYGYKMVSHPYSFAPEELRKAMLMFDDLQPIPDNVTLVLLLVAAVVVIMAFYKLFQFKKIGRTLYLLSIGMTYVVMFSSSYYVYDTFEMILDYTLILSYGFTIAIIYYSSLSKSFK